MIKAAHIYPAENEVSSVRKIAHGIKNFEGEAIAKAAQDISRMLQKNHVLVPVPGASGFAGSSLELAKAISNIKKVEVADILEGKPRASQYASKKFGAALSAAQMQMAVKTGCTVPSNAILIDNAAGTGETIKAALSALGGNYPAIVYAAEKSLLMAQEKAKERFSTKRKGGPALSLD